MNSERKSECFKRLAVQPLSANPKQPILRPCLYTAEWNNLFAASYVFEKTIRHTLVESGHYRPVVKAHNNFIRLSEEWTEKGLEEYLKSL
jgi:hypothetical protein